MGERVGAGHVDETELDAMAVVLQHPQLQQMSPGEMLGSKEFAVFDGLACYREAWRRKIFGRGTVPDGFFMFACASTRSAPIDWCGRTIDAQHIGFGAPSSEVGFWSSAPSDHVVLLVPEKIITAYRLDAPKRDTLSGGGTILCHPEHIRAFVARINAIVGGCLTHPGALDDARTRSVLREQALGALMDCLDDASSVDHAAAKSRRRAALRHAIDYAEAVQGMTTVPELAAIAGVAVRTLELAFREGAGVTPNQYLRRRRMNAVRRDLRDATPGTTTVTRVAATWGFTELGRFAGAYRAMFGELPSETLAAERLVRPRVTALSAAVLPLPSRR